MDKELIENIKQLIKLEKANVELNTELLKDLMNKGVRDIHVLDCVADRLMDSMLGLTGAGEEEYRKYLDYIETFDTKEAKERRDDLEYDLGYKTHVLYAAAILCQKETENLTTKDGQPSFEYIFNYIVPKEDDIMQKVAAFMFFAHYSKRKPVSQLMNMLQAITEETDFVLSHIDDFEDLMRYPREEYHSLRNDEWQLIQKITENNIRAIDEHPELRKKLVDNVFGR